MKYLFLSMLCATVVAQELDVANNPRTSPADIAAGPRTFRSPARCATAQMAKEAGVPDGRPVRLSNIDPTPEGTYLWPGVQGARPTGILPVTIQ
jgi:hypothetical protein